MRTVLFAVLFFMIACKSKQKPPDSDLTSSPEELKEKTTDIIRDAISFAIDNKGKLDDSVVLHNPALLKTIYDQTGYATAWVGTGDWGALPDSLLQLIRDARYYALFPVDYHDRPLVSIHERFVLDTAAKKDRKDAVLWAKSDLMLTDAFLQLVKDLKLGRLPNDSISQRKDSVLSDDFYMEQFRLLHRSGSPKLMAHSLEPKHEGYKLLKAGIKRFLDSADNREYTKVPSPAKGMDTVAFNKAIQKRLTEEGILMPQESLLDSIHLAAAVKRFQQKKGLTADGKAGEGTVRLMNLTDKQKFIRIAIAADRYKLLPEKMPDRYIWVNLPSFYLQLIHSDTVRLVSKIICGRTKTRTPLLTSAVSQMITYPQWTVPQSIIAKEILPAVKKNPGYLARKGFSLVNGDGDEVDPYTVNWEKYKKAIPYKVVQGSGDANALGIMKFNFNNKYAVYLHDTNQRYLFGQGNRSLSHGCVRVQKWEDLMYDILAEDSLQSTSDNYVRVDSVRSWLARKEKRVVQVHNKLPVFIRYFTCEGKDGRIVFYDDIYGEDKLLQERYFAGK